MLKKNYVIYGLLVGILLLAVSSFIFLRINPPQNGSQVTMSEGQVDRVIYKGKDGTSALTLLKEIAEVEEQSGFVTSINGRKAEEKNKEYWAFYLNGQLSQIGAGQYITKNADEIVWKIEQY